MGLGDVIKIADKAMDFADDSFESAEERQKTLTRRLEIDNTSPFMLPHLIRPIIAIWSMVTYTGLAIWAMIKGDMDVMVVLGTSAGILMTVIGFYFNSRKVEKVNAKKAMVAIEIERMRDKVEIKELKRAHRDTRKQRKRDRRKDGGDISDDVKEP